MEYIVKVKDKEFKIDLEKDKSGVKIRLNGEPKKVEVIESNSPMHLYLIVDNKPYEIIAEDERCISVNGELLPVEVKDERLATLAVIKRGIKQIEETPVTVSMSGLVIKVEVHEGERIKAGQGLVVVEAMKMQNEIKAPRDGKVKQVMVKEGVTVNSGDTLVVIE